MQERILTRSGAISSSGVTEALYDFWEYYEPIRNYGPPDCILATQKLTNIIDNILLGKNTTEGLITELKTAFGLQDTQYVLIQFISTLSFPSKYCIPSTCCHLLATVHVNKSLHQTIVQLEFSTCSRSSHFPGLNAVLMTSRYNDDFANALSYGIGGWQGRNWDPAVNDPSFSRYCGNITANSTLLPASASLTSTVKHLVAAGGYASQSTVLTTQMLNYISYVNVTLVQPCLAGGQTTNECYTNHNATFYAQDDITQTWRSWPYQYCTQWGYLQTGASVPSTQLPLISRTITLAYESLVCRDAFNVSHPPDTAVINAYGGYDLSYPRLAFIDGEQDPWRGVTPHAPGAKSRANTVEEPFLLISGAVHHWDENGLFPNETTAALPPAPVRETQTDEVAFVRAWMADWKESS